MRQAGRSDDGLLGLAADAAVTACRPRPCVKSRTEPWQVNPLATLLMMASVAMVIVYLYGELWILGLRFNECALCSPSSAGDACSPAAVDITTALPVHCSSLLTGLRLGQPRSPS